MATCSASALLQEGQDFNDLGDFELRVISVVLLTKILLVLNPMADVTATGLMASARQFSGLPENLLQVIQTQLLCNISVDGISTGGGGGGGTSGGVLSGEGVPGSLIPSTDSAVYYDRSVSAQIVLYWWNGATWIPFG